MTARVPPAPIEGPDAAHEAIERIGTMRSGEISLLYRTLLHTPDIAAGWCALGTAVRWESSLDDGLRELVTSLVASLVDAKYEWRKHAGLALEHGATQQQLGSLPAWQTDPTFTPREQVALAFVEAVTAQQVDDDLFARAEDEFSRQEVVELAATAAYYVAIARFLHACGVE
jgi:alkylhydroperoxidase family enzyme